MNLVFSSAPAKFQLCDQSREYDSQRWQHVNGYVGSDHDQPATAASIPLISLPPSVLITSHTLFLCTQLNLTILWSKKRQPFSYLCGDCTLGTGLDGLRGRKFQNSGSFVTQGRIGNLYSRSNRDFLEHRGGGNDDDLRCHAVSRPKGMLTELQCRPAVMSEVRIFQETFEMNRCASLGGSGLKVSPLETRSERLQTRPTCTVSCAHLGIDYGERGARWAWPTALSKRRLTSTSFHAHAIDVKFRLRARGKSNRRNAAATIRRPRHAVRQIVGMQRRVSPARHPTSVDTNPKKR